MLLHGVITITVKRTPKEIERCCNCYNFSMNKIRVKTYRKYRYSCYRILILEALFLMSRIHAY